MLFGKILSRTGLIIQDLFQTPIEVGNNYFWWKSLGTSTLFIVRYKNIVKYTFYEVSEWIIQNDLVKSYEIDMRLWFSAIKYFLKKIKVNQSE